MPRKAKDEINEISKEVTEKKKTPAKKTATTKAKSTTSTAKKATKTAKSAKTTTAKKETKTTTSKKATKEKKTTATNKAVKEEKATTAKKTAKEIKAAAEKKATKKVATKTAEKTPRKKSTTTRNTKKAVKEEVIETLEIENKKIQVEEKVNVVEYYDLPYRYNQTIVKILAQTPNVLFVYWDISDNDRNNFVAQYGENFFNNTVPVLLVINKTMNYSYEVQINDFANSWYLHVNDANCEYQVELGRRNKENHPDYHHVTTSNNLDMPNDHILLENIPNNVLFKNVKTHELVEKPIVNITFFKDFAKSKDFYKYFKELLNNELEGDEINLNLPSSHTSSSFK